MGADGSTLQGQGNDSLETLVSAMEKMQAGEGDGLSLNENDVHRRLLDAKELISKDIGNEKGFQEILSELEKSSASDIKAKAKAQGSKGGSETKVEASTKSAKDLAVTGEDIRPKRFDFAFKTVDEAKQWEIGFEKLAKSRGLSVEDLDSDSVVLKDGRGEDVTLGEEPDWESLHYPVSGHFHNKVYDAEDVSWGNDGTLVKNRLSVGQDEDVLCVSSKVKIRVEAATDGTSSIHDFKPSTFEFAAGSGDVCDMLELAAINLNRGERAMFTCSNLALCAFPTLGIALPSTGKLVLTLELQEVEMVSDLKKGTNKEKIQFAASQKELGSDLFRRGRTHLALARYKTVLDLFVESDNSLAPDPRSVSETDVKDVKDLTRLCELNRAACFLKLGIFPEARKSCSVVLCEEPGNVKALCRRAQCDIKANNFADAVTDLKKAIELDPQNQAARALLKEARAGQKGCDKESKGLFAKMLQDPTNTKKTPKWKKWNPKTGDFEEENTAEPEMKEVD